MQVRGGMNELMRQAARIQRKIEQAKTDAKEKEISITAAGDKITITVSLGRQIKRIEVEPEFAKAEAFDLVLDSVAAAVNTALEAADKAMEAEVEKATGGVKIPGVV